MKIAWHAVLKLEVTKVKVLEIKITKIKNLVQRLYYPPPHIFRC